MSAGDEEMISLHTCERTHANLGGGGGVSGDAISGTKRLTSKRI